MIFKEDQPEEFYRKLLLLDKVKPLLNNDEKQYIFDKGDCWDILFKDKRAHRFCLEYALYFLNNISPEDYLIPKVTKRFFEGEKYIAINAGSAFLYIKHILRDTWPEAETSLLNNQIYAFKYIQEYKKKPWSEAEHLFISDPYYAYHYASTILKDRWPEAENVILSIMGLRNDYIKFLKKINKFHEIEHLL